MRRTGLEGKEVYKREERVLKRRTGLKEKEGFKREVMV